MNLPTAQDAAGYIVNILKTALDLECAVGGSVALASHKLLNRPIADIDLVCRPSKNDGKLIAVLREHGLRLEDKTVKKARESLTAGKLRLHLDRFADNRPIKFEIFIPSRFRNKSPTAKALVDATYQNVRTCPLGTGLKLVSPEVCVTWKTLFARPSDEQDLVEIRDLANDQGLVLDTLFVERHVADLTGKCSPNMALLRRVFFSNAWYASLSG